jgi:hypothetical protein
MKEFNQMTMDEIEAELKASREYKKQIQIELDKLISFAQDVKSKILNDQTSIDLSFGYPIITRIPRKSMKQKIVELIKENNGKFNSVDICNYFVQQKAYDDLANAKIALLPVFSRLKSDEYIESNGNGEAWKYLKDYP